MVNTLTREDRIKSALSVSEEKVSTKSVWIQLRALDSSFFENNILVAWFMN